MIKKYSVRDASENLLGILGEVGGGDTVHLTGEDGHTVAVLVSLGEYQQLAHSLVPTPADEAPIFEDIMSGFQAAFKTDGCNLDDAFDGIREESNGWNSQP